MLLASSIVSLLLLAQSIPGEEQEIIGWEYRCTEKLETSHGELHGTLTLSDEGEPSGVFAHWSFSPSGNWFTPKGQSALDIRATWIMPHDRFEVELGSISLNATAARPIDRMIQLRLSSSSGPYGAALSAVAERHVGEKRGAAFGFSLRDLLAFGQGREELHWSLAKLTNRAGYAASLAEGRLSLAPIRTVAAAFPKLRERLIAMRSNFRERCERHPVYYDPLSEI